MDPSSADRMMQFTCLNCQVIFKTRDLQRDHYKTDWHRYNLKRKIADLPPVSAEEFLHRLTLVQQENANQNKDKTYTYCGVCKKSFASDQSFQNHLQSKRHIDLQAEKKVDAVDSIAQPSVKNNKCELKLGASINDESDNESIGTASSGTEELDSDEWEEVVSEDNPILSNDCLFCSQHSASFTKNIKHMSVAHSFFIPFIEYLIDMKGLLMYLGEKICRGYLCIWCNDKKNCFSGLNAVRSHMIDKGHTKIAYDSEASLEYADFYHFDLHSDDDDDENTDGDFASVDDSFSAVKSVAIDEEDATMVLPSGDVICHRSLVRYIRQNPNFATKKTITRQSKKLDKLIQHYRCLGWNPSQKEMVKKVNSQAVYYLMKKRERVPGHMVEVKLAMIINEKKKKPYLFSTIPIHQRKKEFYFSLLSPKSRDMKFINHLCSAYQTKLSVKANKLQHHFREQVNY